MNTTCRSLTSSVAAATLSLALGLSPGAPAHAQSAGADRSAGSSALTIATSVVAPQLLFSGVKELTVAAVESTADGAVWVLERAADGSRASVRLASNAAKASGVVAGDVLAVSVIGTGIVLSHVGNAIAFIPNAIGKHLMHNEQITAEPSSPCCQ